MDTLAPVLTLAAVIWTLRVLLPRAVRLGEPLAVTSAALTAGLALSLWLLLGAVGLS